jgi:(p)ppGpp synthase/HD superfamily hydrolase
VELALDAVEVEAERKLRSLVDPASGEVDALLAAVGMRDREVQADVDRAVTFLGSQTSRASEHPSMELYLAHPARVARYVSQVQPAATSRTLQAAVLHNAFEVAGTDPAELRAAGFEDWVAQTVSVLTVDRERDRDPGYLAAHYAAIEDHGDEVVLIKCLDRLDNVLGLAPFDGEFMRGGYLDLTREFIVPMARRLFAPLADYIDAAVDHAREVGFDPRLARLHQAALKATG